MDRATARPSPVQPSAVAVATVVKPTSGATKQVTENNNPSIFEFSTDLNNAEKPEPIPAGEYPATIHAASFKTSQTSGNTYLAVTFKIAPEDYPADYTEGEPEGELLSWNRVVMQDTARARYRAKTFLQSIGAPISAKLDPNDLIGLSATIIVTHDKYEGEDRAQIAKVQSA